MSWKTDLVIRATEPGYGRLELPLVFDDRPEGRFGLVEVPAGTITNLGSTPQPLRRFKAFDPWRTARKSATTHDYLYDKGRWPPTPEHPEGRPVTRAEADEFLRVAIIAEGHSAAVARLWWFGVRAGGWKPWGEYRAADRDTEATDS